MNYEEQNAKTKREAQNSAEKHAKEAYFTNINGIYENGKRVPQKADKKYSEAAQKKRKLAVNEIQEIIDFVKLKLISQRIKI
jgi:hypothetical protein